MSVFISYSHRDADVVGRIARHLIQHDVKVWKDDWKTLAGDAFARKIDEGLGKARFVCVVLSKDAVRSRWVGREIATALEHERRRGVRLLPVRVDECPIPAALRTRLVLDLSSDFERGLKRLTGILAKAYDPLAPGRVDAKTRYFLHYGIERGITDGRFRMRIDVVSFDAEESYCILSQFTFTGDRRATLKRFEVEDVDALARRLLRTCAEEFSANPARVRLDSPNAHVGRFTIHDAHRVARVTVASRIKRLGSFGTATVLFNVGALFAQMCTTSGVEFDDRSGAAVGPRTRERPAPPGGRATGRAQAARSRRR